MSRMHIYTGPSVDARRALILVAGKPISEEGSRRKGCNEQRVCARREGRTCHACTYAGPSVGARGALVLVAGKPIFEEIEGVLVV